MTDSITLRFTYTEDEFVEACQFYAMRAMLKKSDVIGSLAAIVVSLVMTSLNGIHWLWEMLFVAGFLLLVFNFTAYFILPRQHYRREPKYHTEYALTFSEQGIHFKTALAESQLEWGLYDMFWNIPHHYLLFYGRDLFTIIPKRVFANQADEQQFRALLERRLCSSLTQIFPS